MLSALKRPAASFGNALSRLRSRGLSSVASYPKSRLSVLPNGVRVVTEETLPAGDSATVGVWIDAGTRYETKETNGVAHFLEHMAFKGTTKRSQHQLEVEVENLGGHLNAYTSRENTVYYAKVFKKDVPQAMDILSDILQNSKFDPAAIHAERSTILREAKEVDKEKEEVVFDRLHETAFDRCSLGWTILGPEENIASIQREHLVEYIQTHYTGPRMVIAGAGAIQHEELVKLATQMFGNVPAQPPAGAKINLQPAIFTGSDLRVRYDDMDEAHIAYGFPTAGWRDPDHVNLQLMQQMLGTYTWNAPGSQFATAPLAKRLVDEKIATKMSTFNTIYSDTGLFGVYAVSEKYVLQELMDAITEEMTRLSYKVTDEQLAEAKANLKSSLLLNLDGTTQACEEIGRQVLTLGRRMHPAELMARIDAVDAQSVKNTATRFFRDHDFALAALGPLHELPDYNYLRRRTYWLRY